MLSLLNKYYPFVTLGNFCLLCFYISLGSNDTVVDDLSTTEQLQSDTDTTTSMAANVTVPDGTIPDGTVVNDNVTDGYVFAETTTGYERI